MNEKLKNLYTLSDLKSFVGIFSNKLKKGSIVLLKGELGSGKTTFARFLINKLYDLHKIKKPASIKSPSFPILLTYDLNDTEIFHYDLYRLNSVNELYELNIEENLKNAITLVEWPEKILKNKFNYNFYLIEMIIHNENTRIIKNNFIKNSIHNDL